MATKRSVSPLTIVAVLPLLLLGACRSSTWVGHQECYPAGTEPASAEFCLSVTIAGGDGKAYVERSPKNFHLQVENGRNQIVLERDYSAAAGDLRWLSIWPERSNLQVVFYEYRAPMPMERQAKGSTTVPRQILSLAFTFDESKQLFVEATAPPVVLQQAAHRDTRENKRHIVELYFTDSTEIESRILQALEHHAAQYDLQRKAPQPGYIGLLAEWSAKDISQKVVRYDELRQVDVTLEDYARREVSQKISAELRLLPGVVKTRRFVSVNFRGGRESLEPVIRIVEAIANKYGLHQMDRKFYVAKFGSPGLDVSVSFSGLDSGINVFVEDLGWHTQFEEIEQALRSALGTEGGR